MKLLFINVAHAGVITAAPSISSVGINVFNFLLSVVGIIAIIALAISAMMYATSGGDEKRMEAGKKYAQASILGIILAMGCMVIINFLGSFFSR